MVDESRMTRRAALCFIGGGTVVAASSGFETFGFSNISAVRGTSMSVVEDTDALVGLFVADSVAHNKRSLLVEVTNNLDVGLDGTVEFADNERQYGTLYGPGGGDNSGSSVTFSLDGGTEDSAVIEFEPDINDGRVPIAISATTIDSIVSFEGTRETTVSKNTEVSGVAITELKNFKARKNDDIWEVGSISVESDEFELDRVVYEVTDESDSVVGERTDTIGGFSYSQKGVRIEPNDGEDVTKKTQYTLTVRAYDTDGNYDLASATAEG